MESRLVEILEREKSVGAPIDFVILPEGFCRPSIAETMTHIAKKFRCYLLLGSGLDVREKAEYYQTALVIDRSGDVVLRYDKRCVNGMLQKPGKKAGVFRTEYGPASVLICLDIESEKLMEESVSAGVKFVLNPAFIPQKGRARDNMEWRTGLESMTRRLGYYAKNHSLCVCRCDAAGPSARGTSQFITPKYSRMARSNGVDTIIGIVRCRRSEARSDDDKKTKTTRGVDFDTLRVDESLKRDRSERFNRCGARCHIWTLRSAGPKRERSLPRAFDSCVMGIGDGRAVFVNGRKNELELWDLKRRTCLDALTCSAVESESDRCRTSSMCYSNATNIGATTTCGSIGLWTIRKDDGRVASVGADILAKWSVEHGGIADVHMIMSTALDMSTESTKSGPGTGESRTLLACAFDEAWTLHDTRTSAAHSSTVTVPSPFSRSSGRPRVRWGSQHCVYVQRRSCVEVWDTRKISTGRPVHRLDFGSSAVEITSFEVSMFGTSSCGVVGTACGQTSLVNLRHGSQRPFEIARTHDLHGRSGGAVSSVCPVGANGMLTIDGKRSCVHLWHWRAARSEKTSLVSHQDAFFEAQPICNAWYDTPTGSLLLALSSFPTRIVPKRIVMSSLSASQADGVDYKK